MECIARKVEARKSNLFEKQKVLKIRNNLNRQASQLTVFTIYTIATSK